MLMRFNIIDNNIIDKRKLLEEFLLRQVAENRDIFDAPEHSGDGV